jgi:hypothetical protein
VLVSLPWRLGLVRWRGGLGLGAVRVLYRIVSRDSKFARVYFALITVSRVDLHGIFRWAGKYRWSNTEHMGSAACAPTIYCDFES